MKRHGKFDGLVQCAEEDAGLSSLLLNTYHICIIGSTSYMHCNKSRIRQLDDGSFDMDIFSIHSSPSIHYTLLVNL